MFNGKYTHINRVIEDIYREYPFDNVYIDEAREYVWMCLGYFGRDEILIDSSADVIIEDNRGLLPSDMYKFIACREKSTKIPLLPSTDIYFDLNKSNNTLGQAIVQGQSINKTTVVGENIITDLDIPTVYLDLVPVIDSASRKDYKYKINSDYIFCGFDTTLEVEYKAFPIWEDNTPMIPDDEKVIRMIKLFIAEKIAKRLWMLGKLSKQVLEDIRDEQDFAIGSAQNRMKLPDEAEMESIRRMQMRLRPIPNQYRSGFRYANDGETLNRM